MRMNRRIWARTKLGCFVIQPDLHRQTDSIFARLVDSVSARQPIRENYGLRSKVGVWNVERHTTDPSRTAKVHPAVYRRNRERPLTQETAPRESITSLIE